MPLQPWHIEKLDEEFTSSKAEHVQTLEDYLRLEDRLFAQLDAKVYSRSEAGPEHQIDRYSAGSAADPRKHSPDWNRSFELAAEQPRGGVLLLHGMSDSPYSLRAIGEALNERGYHVLGIRLPGHGTAPSGLRFISRQDLAAAVRLGMKHLLTKVDGNSVHVIGYSTGAALALEYSLDALEGKVEPVPASLILISPAIGVSAGGGLASFKDSLSNLPGLSRLAYLSIQHEFDPYKYNSFATNAGDVVHGLTQSVARRISDRAQTSPDAVLPPTLLFKSTVDATVSTAAVVDRLLKHLKPDRHELVLFDVNRFAVIASRLLIDDPAPLTDRVMRDETLPFSVTLVTNKNAETREVARKSKAPFSNDVTESRPLELSWPSGVVSLSHLALPIPPDDPLYGRHPPESADTLFLGQMALQGERGLLRIPADWFFRLRHNPFYSYLQERALGWVDDANDPQN